MQATEPPLQEKHNARPQFSAGRIVFGVLGSLAVGAIARLAAELVLMNLVSRPVRESIGLGAFLGVSALVLSYFVMRQSASKAAILASLAFVFGVVLQFVASRTLGAYLS